MLDMFSEQWRDRYGWVIGALIIMTAVAVMIAQYDSVRPPRILHLVGFAVGLAIGGLLFSPAVPRIIIALRKLVMARVPMDASGPFPVATADVALPSATADDPAILVQIWFPTAGDPSAVAALPESAPPHSCSAFLEHRQLAGAERPFPILLYVPGNGQGKDDNASTAAELASHGYIIMAIDDIDRDPRPIDAAGEILQPLAFDFASAEAFKTTLRTGDRKVRLQAERALMALDRFEASANADWRDRVCFDHVGFFGFSFGGATAAEAGTFDPRVVAVANLDGWLFGRAAFGALETPYMIILIKDGIFPGPRQLGSADPNERNFATLMERDLREEVRLANRPDGFGYRIRTSYHENLSDQIFGRSFFKTWLLTNPYRVKSIRDAYLRAFFDTYLRGMPSPLLTQSPAPFHEVETLHANGYWIDEAAKSRIGAVPSQN
jgi:dienelactone hydrolase